ncbi:MAG TPA: cytochrome c maturation protein CcmE [Candidatus Limnocylindria bacterium]|nr:cytochrome c maturation protein CcmE [Candidatus Limnocylindria bacterium]
MSAPAADARGQQDSGRASGRRLLAIAALALAVAIGVVAAQNLQTSAVYYLTPTEARQRGIEPGRAVRLGGQVLAGTLAYEPASRDLRFSIGDGVTTVRVVGTGAPPGLLREGAGAVVEGSFAADGTFRATQVIAKHDEVYEAPPPGATPSHRTAP